MSELLEGVGNPQRFLHQIKASSNQSLIRTPEADAIFVEITRELRA